MHYILLPTIVLSVVHNVGEYFCSIFRSMYMYIVIQMSLKSPYSVSGMSIVVDNVHTVCM